MKPREMNMKTRRALWPAAVGLIIAGCVALHLSDGTSPVQPSDGRASRAPTLDPGVVASAALHARTAIPVARELRLPGHATIARSGSYEEMVSSLTAEERATVEALYRAWGAGWEGAGVPNHILVFHDEAQLEWLVRNGFPTPEELLAALKMSDNELLELANTGNIKAEALYLTRKALQPPDDETPVDQTRRLAREMEMESRLVGSGTAFSAYVVALRADRAGRAHEALAA